MREAQSRSLECQTKIFEQIKNNPDLAKQAVEIMKDEKQSQICTIS
jgi:hypothetical protein